MKRTEICCDNPDIVTASDGYMEVAACRNCGTIEPWLLDTFKPAEEEAA